jgi:tetratricopeptide (TPR) repeat protein
MTQRSGAAASVDRPGDIAPSPSAADLAHSSDLAHAKSAQETELAQLRQRGVERLRAGAAAEAIELLSQALALDARDAATQLNLGIALQGAGRHAEALTYFRSVQGRLPDAPASFLRAAMSLLALGDAAAALQAASDACHRGANLPQAHYLHGQACLAMSEPAKAERAFARAIALSPTWADAWVNYGVARYRQGAIEDAKTAMRKVLAFAPNHAAATSNLAALMRISGAAEPVQVEGESLPALSLWKPTEPAAALGLAVEFLMQQPVFARLPFGDWSQVLVGQINRGHFSFAVDARWRVQGFIGWALTSERLAEQWVEGRASLSEQDCRDGDCAIVNAWAATSAEAHRLLIDEGLRLFGRKLRIYAKRYNIRGEPRPLRIDGDAPADKFAAVMRATAKSGRTSTRRRQDS